MIIVTQLVWSNLLYRVTLEIIDRGFGIFMYLLFDFDGTIVNSYDCVIETTNLLAEQFNLRKIEKHEIEHLRDLTFLEVKSFWGFPFIKYLR